MVNGGMGVRGKRGVALLCALILMTAVADGQTVQPNSAAAHFATGFRLQQVGESEKALEAYGAALRLDPKHLGARVNSGILYMALGKYEEAATAFKKGVAGRPEDARLRLYLGQAYFAVGNKTCFRKLLQTEPTHVFAIHALGIAYNTTGDKNAAM